jgi:hypothetical protein
VPDGGSPDQTKREPDATRDLPPAPIPGRGRLRDYALGRLKQSRVLQVSMVLAILCYGALPVLVIWPDPAEPRIAFWSAALMVLMSLASWTLLFWWYPVLERTQEILGDGERGRTIAHTLEAIAIGCVLVVHLLMAFIIVRAGVEG